DEHGGRPVLAAPFGDLGCETGAVEILAPLVEQHHGRLGWNDIGERNRFLEHALARIVGAALADFDDLDVAQAELAAGLRGAFGIAFGKLGFGALFQASDGGNNNAHNARSVADLVLARAPHLFQRVEVAHLGPEDVGVTTPASVNTQSPCFKPSMRTGAMPA